MDPRQIALIAATLSLCLSLPRLWYTRGGGDDGQIARVERKLDLILKHLELETKFNVEAPARVQELALMGRLARATEFYCSALGLRVARRFEVSAVELLGGSTPIYLLKKASGSAASSAATARRDYSRQWTPVHLDFVVPDISTALARARSAGASLEGEVHTYKWGRIAAMADPFGHGFCLIEFLGRGYDEIA